MSNLPAKACEPQKIEMQKLKLLQMQMEVGWSFSVVDKHWSENVLIE